MIQEQCKVCKRIFDDSNLYHSKLGYICEECWEEWEDD